MNLSHTASLVAFAVAVSVGTRGLADAYDWHVKNGIAAVRASDYPSALDEFGKAIALEPHRATAYYLRGRTYLAMGECDGAISDFSRTIDIQPRHAEAYLDRASALSATGDNSGALKDAETANRILFARLRWMLLLRQAWDRVRSPASESIEKAMEADRLQFHRRYKDYKQIGPPPSKLPALPQLKPSPDESSLSQASDALRTGRADARPIVSA